ncbi:MAG: hypothetical protein AAFV71_27390 [Cyanobacteria bacterium J06633_8]
MSQNAGIFGSQSFQNESALTADATTELDFNATDIELLLSGTRAITENL